MGFKRILQRRGSENARRILRFSGVSFTFLRNYVLFVGRSIEFN